MSGYGAAIRAEFAKTYARQGNATRALKAVLGAERADRMKPHTLRARASELLNDYRTVALIEQEKRAIRERGERLPKYRLRTWRADLMAEMPEANKQARQNKAKQKSILQEIAQLYARIVASATAQNLTQSR